MTRIDLVPGPRRTQPPNDIGRVRYDTNTRNLIGDKFCHVISDLKGSVGIDYGVYGVPETYVIDRAGIIRYKHIGAISFSQARNEILPLVRKLQE